MQISRKPIYKLILVLICLPVLIWSQNPIVPPGLYMADPTAKVWDDGKLYIYGSVDESVDYYCSHKYNVLSSDNLLDWTLHENSFYSKGEADQVGYSDALLFAPDCVVKGDSFYLYYCQPDPVFAEGVAASASRTGPFENATAINTGNHNQIDPCLFMDDDGQAYYIWGQSSVKMAKMNPDMRTLDLSTLDENVINEKDHFFHEGAHMVKREGIYYLLYAHLGRADMPTCIGYCTSTSPMGPFEYGGVIVDNDHCDPGNWNNHGSIMEFGGQWYVFYHRATHNSKMMRKACIEPIFFNEDGSIDEVPMTSQGAGPPLPATSRIPAEHACQLYGNVRIRMCAGDNEELGGIRDQDKAAYKYVDFKSGVESIRLRVKPGLSPGGISVKADMPWGPQIAYVSINEAAEGATETTWLEVEAKADHVEGVHALWLVFDGKGDDLFSVDWIEFR